MLCIHERDLELYYLRWCWSMLQTFLTCTFEILHNVVCRLEYIYELYIWYWIKAHSILNIWAFWYLLIPCDSTMHKHFWLIGFAFNFIKRRSLQCTESTFDFLAKSSSLRSFVVDCFRFYALDCQIENGFCQIRWI